MLRGNFKKHFGIKAIPSIFLSSFARYSFNQFHYELTFILRCVSLDWSSLGLVLKNQSGLCVAYWPTFVSLIGPPRPWWLRDEFAILFKHQSRLRRTDNLKFIPIIERWFMCRIENIRGWRNIKIKIYLVNRFTRKF